MVRPLVGLLILLLTTFADAKDNVRKELARLQEQTGLTIAWYLSGIETVQFSNRSVSKDQKSATSRDIGNGLISPDGAEIALPSQGPIYLNGTAHLKILQRNGTEAREYPEISEADAICWSHDKSKLLVQAKIPQTKPPQYHLLIVDMGSKAVQEVATPGHTSNQCWSADDKNVVYSANNEIRVFDIRQATSTTIANGSFPSWSPDGQRIAFSEGDEFYAISPHGKEKKLLFKARKSRSELWWSPDSRFVAYLSEGGTFFETLKVLDVGLIQLRVRRLADGAEDWVYQTPDVPPAWFLNCVWLAKK